MEQLAGLDVQLLSRLLRLVWAKNSVSFAPMQSGLVFRF